MGKPAARMGDTTAHGGTIILGLPTVLVGKKPVAALGDMHVCPMCTGPVPHVGGPITLGSMGVLVGKKPTARLSDITVCVGPPSMPVLGCMTVLIGEIGSGSQAGSAASAMAAAASKQKGPKAIEPFPLGEPPKTTEIHNIECEFQDSAGRPLSGVSYKLTDPKSQIMKGVTTCDGRIYHGGYDKAGSFKVSVKGLANAKWSKAKAKAIEEVQMEADAEGFEDGVEATIGVFAQFSDNDYTLVKNILCKVSGKKIKGAFKPDPPTDEEVANKKPQPSAYFFIASSEGLVSVSQALKIVDTAEFKLKDAEGKGMAGLEYEVQFGNGTLKKGKLDSSGAAKLEDVPPGPFKVRFIPKKKAKKN